MPDFERRFGVGWFLGGAGLIAVVIGASLVGGSYMPAESEHADTLFRVGLGATVAGVCGLVIGVALARDAYVRGGMAWPFH